VVEVPAKHRLDYLRRVNTFKVSSAKVDDKLCEISFYCEQSYPEVHEAWNFNAPKPRHNTYWMYRKHGCRCKACITAYKAKGKEWRERIKARQKPQ
jgi:hypothetical protein